MKADLIRADVTYEVFFKKPLLDRPVGVPALIQSVYDALSEAIAVSVADIMVNQSPTPAQTSVIYNLFGGAGSIEIRADRWRGVFHSLVSTEDINLITRCLQIVASAIETTSDRLSPARTNLTVAGWYACDVSRDDVASVLENYWMPKNEMAAKFLDAEEIEYVLNPKLKNKSEGWEATFYVAVSALEKTELFLNYIGNYIHGGRYNSIDQQRAHVRLMLAGMLNKLGFETRKDEVNA